MVMDGPARDSTSKALPPPGEPCELPCGRAWRSDVRWAFGEPCSVIPAPEAIVPAAIGARCLQQPAGRAVSDICCE